jgi:hypothetical protein
MNFDFTIRPRRIAVILWLIAIGLCLTSITFKAIEWNLRSSNYAIYSLSGLFNVNRETTIPTFFSALLLLSCAVLLALSTRVAFREHALVRDPLRWFWAGLTVIFTYLALDEAAEIHEIFTTPLEENLSLEGHLFFGWVLVGMAFVVIIGIPYSYFIFKLPSKTRLLVIASAAIYIGGALGVEMISANIWYEGEGTSLRYSAVGTLEEFMEMSGIILFSYTLLRHLSHHMSKISLYFGENPAD